MSNDTTLASVLIDQMNLSETAEVALTQLEEEMISMMIQNNLTQEECLSKVRWCCIYNAAKTGYYDINGKMVYFTLAWYETMLELINEMETKENESLTDDDNHRIEENESLTDDDYRRIEEYYIMSDMLVL